MICLDCFKQMQEVGPDTWKCSGCGFQAEQMSLWGCHMVEFNKQPPEYGKVITYNMSEGERAALEARKRDKVEISGFGLLTLAPQQGMYGGKKYRRKGGEK